MQRKRIFLFVLLSLFFVPFVLHAAEPVQLHEETAHSISFTVDVPEPVFISAGDTSGVTCSIEGFSLHNESGMPGVVQRGVMAAIPPGSGVEMTISVLASQDFKNIDLAPVPTFAPGSSIPEGEDSFLYSKNSNIYSQNVFFPSQTADIAYTGTLRDMPFVQLLIKPVQYNPVQRIVRVVRSMVITLTFDRFDEEVNTLLGLPDGTPAPIGRVFDSIRTTSIINPGSDFKGMMRDQYATPAIMRSPVDLQSSPFAIKIVTSGSGIHRVGYEDIAGLGVDISGLTNSNLKIANSGQQIAVYRSGTGQFDSGDYILFYAENFQSDYSSTNVFWLYQGSGSGLTMQTLGCAPESGFPQPEAFTTSMSFEQNLVWRRNLPDYLDGEDEWFWEKLDVFNINDFDIVFELDDFATDGNLFELGVLLRGVTPSYHHTQFILNGTQIGDVEWFGTAVERLILSGISPALLNKGSNTLKVQVQLAAGNEPTTPDQYYLNRAELTYDRHYIADSNRLAFGADTSGGTTFEVNGFSDPGILVFDISQPQAPVVLTETSVSTTDGTSSVRFEKNIDVDTALYAVTPDSVLDPDTFIVDNPSDLMSERTDIDYIIITHAQFASTVEDLKTIREQSGLSVEIVDVQDIYDEFSYGIKDVTAIKDFLRYAYFNWHATDHPTYVVLVGDATYDYRDNLGLASSGKADLVPTYLGYRGSLGSSVGATASDNWFVCVDGDDPLPDMVIGRLCVKNDQDLLNIIDKIETYQNSPQDEWQSQILFAADKHDENMFEYMAESLVAILPARYADINLYLGSYGTDITTATDDLIDEISNGALITNYIGHGSTDTWSKSRWFQTPNQNTGSTRDDVLLLTNTDTYTFLMILNCLSGTFSEVTDDYCMAEEFMRQEQRGAVFSVAPSASGFPTDHELLGVTMYENLFEGNILAPGVLLTLSKIDAYQKGLSRDILETFTFFGDPALELQVLPECTVDGDCERGICISNVCVVEGSLQIDKCTVKAGKNDKGDRIKFLGLLDATDADFLAAIGGEVIVAIEADDIPDLNATTFTFSIDEDSFNKGKYKSPKVKSADKSDPVTSIKVDTIKGKIKFSGKNLDLSGLSCPITVVIKIGSYVAEIVLDEDIVNGPNKPCPPELIKDI